VSHSRGGTDHDEAHSSRDEGASSYRNIRGAGPESLTFRPIWARLKAIMDGRRATFHDPVTEVLPTTHELGFVVTSAFIGTDRGLSRIPRHDRDCSRFPRSAARTNVHCTKLSGRTALGSQARLSAPAWLLQGRERPSTGVEGNREHRAAGG
jgi:hypothetical protein